MIVGNYQISLLGKKTMPRDAKSPEFNMYSYFKDRT